MKTSNHDFLEKIAKEALEKANEMDVDEPKLVWPKPEEVRYQKPKEQEKDQIQPVLCWNMQISRSNITMTPIPPLDAHLGGFFYGCKKKRPQKGRRPGDAIAGGAIFCEILALK